MGYPIKSILVKLSCIAVAAILVISAVYAWLLPGVNGRHKTYSILNLVALAAAFAGGFNTFKSCNCDGGKIKTIMISIFTGLAVAAFVIYFSLLIIVNIA